MQCCRAVDTWHAAKLKRPSVWRAVHAHGKAQSTGSLLPRQQWKGCTRKVYDISHKTYAEGRCSVQTVEQPALEKGVARKARCACRQSQRELSHAQVCGEVRGLRTSLRSSRLGLGPIASRSRAMPGAESGSCQSGVLGAKAGLDGRLTRGERRSSSPETEGDAKMRGSRVRTGRQILSGVFGSSSPAKRTLTMQGAARAGSWELTDAARQAPRSVRLSAESGHLGTISCRGPATDLGRAGLDTSRSPPWASGGNCTSLVGAGCHSTCPSSSHRLGLSSLSCSGALARRCTLALLLSGRRSWPVLLRRGHSASALRRGSGPVRHSSSPAPGSSGQAARLGTSAACSLWAGLCVPAGEQGSSQDVGTSASGSAGRCSRSCGRSSCGSALAACRS
mmetsp:Transcript_99000/g.280393  ORF Transcript_99000/g.280393 Transcript_99000/m.280393 type:complete len:393 (+) Transcript_99000:45-1223(+)